MPSPWPARPGYNTEEELAPDHQIFGNWESYFYNNMSLSRLMGVRMPGGDVAAIDPAYLGDHPDVPVYEPDPRDESPERTEHLGRTLAWIMSTDRCEAMDEGVVLSRKVQAGRPDFSTLSERQLVDDPASFSPVLRQREGQFAGFAELEPPWIVDIGIGPPPVNQWRRRGTGGARPAEAGEVLQGVAAAPGRATGRARIVLDPATAELEPGDVLVCRATDPSWAPLFLATSAVVCDVGAIGSHAAIVGREIGVPCAVSVTDATRRILEGATVSVDGSTGGVIILAVA